MARDPEDSETFDMFGSPSNRGELTPIVRRVVQANSAIVEEEPSDISYLHSVLCQAMLPYRDPGAEIREWERVQGKVSLRIEAGSVLDPQTKRFEKIGLPYGEKPRLVMIHLSTEAIKNKSPVVDVGDSMTQYVKSLGIDPNGRNIRTLKDQLSRLAAARVQLGMFYTDHALQIDTKFVTAFDLWFPKDDKQRVLWPTTVRLSNEYYNTLIDHAVPLDHRAVAALAHSAMSLDIYCWLAQRLYRVGGRKSILVPWPALQEQFGSGFARLRKFREKFLVALRSVNAVYPEAKIDADGRGLMLHHSPPPVAQRTFQVRNLVE